MSYAGQLKRQKHETERLLRAAAAQCEAKAEAGIFFPVGARCGFCVHALKDGGCRLRVLAQEFHAA